jgi:hypothetical protein
MLSTFTREQQAALQWAARVQALATEFRAIYARGIDVATSDAVLETLAARLVSDGYSLAFASAALRQALAHAPGPQARADRVALAPAIPALSGRGRAGQADEATVTLAPKQANERVGRSWLPHAHPGGIVIPPIAPETGARGVLVSRVATTARVSRPDDPRAWSRDQVQRSDAERHAAKVARRKRARARK